MPVITGAASGCSAGSSRTAVAGIVTGSRKTTVCGGTEEPLRERDRTGPLTASQLRFPGFCQ